MTRSQGIRICPSQMRMTRIINSAKRACQASGTGALNVLLPNRRIEVSALYYDRTARRQPGPAIDLGFASIMRALDLPMRAAHDAFNDALMAAMMYLRLAAPLAATQGVTR